MSDPEQSLPTFHSVEALLHQVSFCRSLSRVDLARLIGAFEDVDFPADAPVFAEGAEADGLYLLASGRVAITVTTADGERQVASLEAPAHFGDLGLLLARRTASARTLTNVHAFKLPRRRFAQPRQDPPAIGLAAAPALAEPSESR